MANYVSATIHVHGPPEEISAFIEKSVSKADGTYDVICLGGLYSKFRGGIARLWDPSPPTFQELRKDTEKTSFSVSCECAWSAPHCWLIDVSTAYPKIFFILQEDSIENDYLGVTAYQGGVIRYEQGKEFNCPEFIINDKGENISEARWEEGDYWDDCDIDCEAFSGWLWEHIEKALQHYPQTLNV